MSQTLKALFISHGGGPMPLLGDPGHLEMVTCLQTIASNIPTPDAIVVVSAHWEEKTPSITSGKTPELIYDYYGFPEESYQIQYPCNGEPGLANELHDLLNAANFDATLDERRGFDHGLFVPLKIMYPDAQIPCVQLSLVANLDPASHIQMGQTLSHLSDRNILVIGSGFSFHNLRAFFAASSSETQQANHEFEAWLQHSCSSLELSEHERTQRLIHWADAPGARYCHPREEHLLPLHVCYGVATAACSTVYPLKILEKECSMYLW